MRVTISVLGRAHLFNLARQMQERGNLERIFSGFPWASLAREGVSRSRVTTLPVVRPLMMLNYPQGLRPSSRAMQALHWASATSQDWVVSNNLPETDVFVAAEGLGLWSGPAAQRRGAVFVLDKGTSHMGWRENLLREEYERVGLGRYFVRSGTHTRELEEYALADRIVVPSAFAKASFVAAGVAADKVAVVPYGVEPRSFAPVGTPPSDIFELVFVGQLSVRKGAFDLFAALDLLESRRVRLSIVGCMEPAIESALRRRLYQDDIRMLGRQPHGRLQQVLSRSHALVLPSIEDGFGLVVTEAMACACPVIVSTNAGGSEAVDDGVEGFVVPIRSPAAIAEAVEWMITHPAERQAMGEAALRKTQRAKGWNAYGDAMQREFERLRHGVMEVAA